MPRPQRDPKREQTWRRHIEQQRASGLTVRAFCSFHNLKETSFFYWKKEIARREAASSPAASTSSAAPAFVPVAVIDLPADPTETPIDIRLADGPRVRVRSGCDRELLADVLAMLRRSAAASTEGPPC